MRKFLAMAGLFATNMLTSGCGDTVRIGSNSTPKASKDTVDYQVEIGMGPRVDTLIVDTREDMVAGDFSGGEVSWRPRSVEYKDKRTDQKTIVVEGTPTKITPIPQLK